MFGKAINYMGLFGGAAPPDEAREKSVLAGKGLAPVAIDPDTVISEAEYLVFDTELTGMKPRRDSIVSIGAVAMRGDRILVGRNFHRIVSPRTKLTDSSVVIHGITPTEAAESPAIASVLPEFLDLCRGKVVVGHVVSIDLRFINREIELLQGEPLTNPAVDTMSLYGFLRKKTGDYCAFHEGVPGRADLFSLCKEYGISVTRAHDALYDAFVTAQLFQRFLAVLPEYGIHTIRDLKRIGKP
jgi:DNA polymerase-3 subunit epsilon